MTRFNLPTRNDGDVGTKYLGVFFTPEHKHERAEERVRMLVSLASLSFL